jgi:hypothetical protein
MEKLTSRLCITAVPDEYLFKWKPLIRLRTIRVVHLWMETAWNPDFVSKEARTALEYFIRCIPATFGTSPEEVKYNTRFKDIFLRIAGYTNEYVNLLNKKNESSVLPPTSESIMSPDRPKQIEFAECEPYDVAISLFFRDHELMSGITPLHLLVRLWQDEADPLVSQYISVINNIIASFNTVF